MIGAKQDKRATWVMMVQMALLALLPLLVVLSHRNIVGLMFLLGIAALFQPGRTGLRAWLGAPFRRATLHPFLTFAGLFSLYAAVATFWAPQGFDLEVFVRQPIFYGIIVCLLGEAVVMAPKQARVLAQFFAWMVIISMLGLGFEALTGGWLRDVTPPLADPARDNIATARGTTIAIIVFFPAALILASSCARFPLAFRVAVLALAFAGLTLAATTFDSSTNAAALGLGLVMAMVGYFWPKPVLGVVAACFVIALVTAPLMAWSLPPVADLAEIQSVPASWVQRLIIWQHTSAEIFASPGQFLFGGGGDYGRALTSQSGTIMIKQLSVPLDLFPTHPHNIFLHIWLEFGAIGAVLAAASFGFLGRALVKMHLSRELVAAATGLAVATFIMAYVDASLWTFWRLVAPVLAVYGLVLYHRSIS
ncbi:MAG: O-antigen ligase family protein [Parvularculaceae bacterium]